jgi:GTPase SAR1 family protein
MTRYCVTTTPIMTLKLSHPSSCLVVGASFCGKTTLTKWLIEERMFEPFPERIIWCYGEYQPLHDQMSSLGIEFVEGVPADLYDNLDSSKST